jgi:hypothetical protein
MDGREEEIELSLKVGNSSEKNSVKLDQIRELYSQHFIFFQIYEWAQ